MKRFEIRTKEWMCFPAPLPKDGKPRRIICEAPGKKGYLEILDDKVIIHDYNNFLKSFDVKKQWMILSHKADVDWKEFNEKNEHVIAELKKQAKLAHDRGDFGLETELDARAVGLEAGRNFEKRVEALKSFKPTEGGPKMLPVVDYEGEKYFFDKRLRQIRNVKNPHDFQDLNDFEMEYFEDKVSKNE